MKLSNIKTKELFKLYADLMKELRKRGITRSNNNPVADYAEFLIARKFKLKLTPNSNKSFDAWKGKAKYQIKSRRMTSKSKLLQLSVIRSLGFDFLIAVIFDENFSIHAVYKLSRNLVKKYAKFSEHQNGYILRLEDKVLKDKSVKKIKV